MCNIVIVSSLSKYEMNIIISLPSKKYRLKESRNLYNASIRLVIKNFTRSDAGQYKCVATNSLGRSDESIRLYVIDVPSPK